MSRRDKQRKSHLSYPKICLSKCSEKLVLTLGVGRSKSGSFPESYAMIRFDPGLDKQLHKKFYIFRYSNLCKNI